VQPVKESHTTRNIIIILVILILIGGLVAGFFYFNKSNRKGEVIENYLKSRRCLSLCPTEVREGYNSEGNLVSFRTLKEDCSSSCDKYTKGITRIEQEKYLDTNEEVKRISKGVFDCLTNSQLDLNFDYKACGNKIFEENKGIMDLSDFKLESYEKSQKHDLTIK